MKFYTHFGALFNIRVRHRVTTCRRIAFVLLACLMPFSSLVLLLLLLLLLLLSGAARLHGGVSNDPRHHLPCVLGAS